MRTKQEIIVGIASNLYGHNLYDPRKKGEQNATEFHLHDIMKLNHAYWSLQEDLQRSKLPNFPIRYEVENCGWSFSVWVEKDGEWVRVYDHSQKLEVPEWLN